MAACVTLMTKLERTHIPASGGEVLLLVQIHATARERTDRLPLNLAAVLDRSGSMQGAKLAYSRHAVAFLVDQLAAQDRLAVVTYDDQVERMVPSQHILLKDLLKARIAAIQTGGATNLSGGLATGMQQVGLGGRPNQVNRVLLLTDGLANVGVTEPGTLVGWAQAWRERGLTLSTLGVGNDFNEDLLVALAEAGGGSFHYIENPDRIPAIFAAELQGLLQVAAQGLQLQVAAEPGVAITEVVGFQPYGSTQQVGVPLPDLFDGETKPLLFRLAVAAPPAPGGTLVRIRLSYLPAEAGAQPQELEAAVTATVTEDPALLAAPPDPDVVREEGLLRAALAREEAVRRADAGDTLDRKSVV